MRRATRLLLPVALAIAPLVPRPALAAGACKVVRHRRRGSGDERRVAAMRNNLPNVLALGSLVIDLDTGQELFSRKPDQPRSIASISKLAAMLVVMDHHLQLDELTTMSKVDVEVARGGATSRLPVGMTLSNRDLLHAALLGSDNRAVSALGRAVGLAAPQFAQEMTKKAAQLGLKHTHFREPTGLSPENVSTPRELIVLLRTAMANPTLGPILRRVEYDAHPVARAPIKYTNTNKPAHRGATEVLGGKTGYNDVARYCLVLAARIDGRRYGMAFLGTEGKMTRFGDAARVADWLVLHKPPPGGPQPGIGAPASGPALAQDPAAPTAAPPDAGTAGLSAGTAPALGTPASTVAPAPSPPALGSKI